MKKLILACISTTIIILAADTKHNDLPVFRDPDFSTHYYYKKKDGFKTRIFDRKWRTKYYKKGRKTYDRQWRHKTRW
jgi:hypothetical protein